MNLLLGNVPIECPPPPEGFIEDLREIVRNNHERFKTISFDQFLKEISERYYRDESLSLWALHTILFYRTLTSSERERRSRKCKRYLKCVNEILCDEEIYWKVHDAAASLKDELTTASALCKRGPGNPLSMYRNAASWYLIYGRRKRSQSRVRLIFDAIGERKSIDALESFQKRYKSHFSLSF